MNADIDIHLVVKSGFRRNNMQIDIIIEFIFLKFESVVYGVEV